MTMHARLKLQASNHEDLTIISACLQDAILPAAAMSYHPDEQLFALMINRFMWEQAPEIINDSLTHKRVHSGLYFFNIHHIEHENINPHSDQEFLNLLSVQPHQSENIHLIFSGNKRLCLHTHNLQCYLKDLHDPWHTSYQPNH